MKKIVLIIGLALVSVACGGGGDDGVEIPAGGGNGGDDNGDVLEELPIGEYDCAAVAVVEPLPSGTHPTELVGTWDCEDSDGSTNVETYNSDGTFYVPHIEQPAWAAEQWDECRVGTKPPAIAGHWVVRASDNMLCARFDAIPYSVVCSPYRINQAGQLVASAGDVLVAYENGEVESTMRITTSSVCEKR